MTYKLRDYQRDDGNKRIFLAGLKCQIDSCNGSAYCKMFCKKHYARAKRHNGDPLKTRNHGYRKNKSVEYTSWCHMKARCYNKKNKDFHYYGGRGITICEEWKNDFLKFLDDMGKRPEWADSIDRINTNGNYEPGNCRWATTYTQVKNRRKQKTNTSGMEGVNPTKDGGWMARITIHGERHYLGYFHTKELAFQARLNAEKEYQNV